MNANLMNPAAKILVMVGGELACVKLVGRANFASSLDFKTLIHELRARGYARFVLDLSECALMDSTFLGGLAGFGLEMAKSSAGACASAIELLNPNERITELLEDLGILYLFKCCQGALAPPTDAETTAVTCSIPSRLELARASLEAHELLMGLNRENALKFKDVAQFLAEDLRRLGGGQTP